MNKKFTLNIPAVLCEHVLGPRHNKVHHMTAGVGVMVVGVLVAKSATIMPDVLMIHVTVDLVGYLIHAVGAVPFIEHLIEENRE